MTDGKGQEDWPSPNDGFRRLESKLDDIIELQRRIMSSITNLQAADTSLQTEVVQILQDIVTSLAGNNVNIDAVTADINAQITALQTGDPIQPPAPSA